MIKYKDYTTEKISKEHFICKKDSKFIGSAIRPHHFLQLIYEKELQEAKILSLGDFEGEL